MRKTLFVPILALLLIFGFRPEKTIAAPEVVFAKHTVEVDPIVLHAVKTVLETNSGRFPSLVTHYAVTDFGWPKGQKSGFVSVLALDLNRTRPHSPHSAFQIYHPEQPETSSVRLDNWTMFDNGVLPTLIVLQATADGRIYGAMQGTAEFTEMLAMIPELSPAQRAGMDPLQAEKYKTMGMEGPSTGLIFPFYPETSAVYGPAGVHPNDFWQTGWVAVDIMGGPTTGASMPNAIYAVENGVVDFICRDPGYQVSIKAGSIQYTHLLDDPTLQVGSQLTQAHYIGALRSGTFDLNCENAVQDSTTFHVHLGFPDYGQQSFEGWTLNTTSETWHDGLGNTVSPGQYLTAHWIPSGPPPAPPPGGPPPPDPGPGSDGDTNFWDFALEGLIDMVNTVVPILPEHEAMQIADRVLAVATVALEVIYVIFLTNFDMTVFVWVVGIIFIIESVRMLYAGWKLVKEAIPVIG